MTSLYILDVPENHGVARVAADCPGVITRMVGPYFEFTRDGEIVVDRRATGARHAVWYSTIAGLRNARIAQHDKNALRLEARD